jgi:FMN phosphatase YigB (HAD superfamily)
MYRAALAATGTRACDALAVGDSFTTDVEPALRLGARAAWARYGRRYDAGLWDTLLAVSPWTTSAVAQQDAVLTCDAAPLDAFSDILSLI